MVVKKNYNSSINRVCYRSFELEDPCDLAAYESIGGYSVWRNIIKNRTSSREIVDTIKNSFLRGRGGAGFATGLKMSFIQESAPKPRYLVCNSDEGEPGTCKDTLILRYNPHQIIEGMLISCYAQGMEFAYNYMRGEFLQQYASCERALAQASKASLVGKNILGSDISIHIYNILGAGSYIVGEETAMLESLEGKRAMPRVKPPFPASHGLYGYPTTVNNTETIASIPVILEKGSDWFLSMGCQESGGTKIFCVSGHVQSPGVFELPLGTRFVDLLAMAGGIKPGRKLKAVIPGGSSMKVLPADVIMGLTMDYKSISSAGSGLGSGAVIVMDDSTCMVDALACISKFYKEESCGQCTPCREGSGWVMKIVHRILQGKGEKGDIEKLHLIAKSVEGRTICAFGEAFAWPVIGFIDHFRHEFEYFIEHKKSMVTGLGASDVR